MVLLRFLQPSEQVEKIVVEISTKEEKSAHPFLDVFRAARLRAASVKSTEYVVFFGTEMQTQKTCGLS